MAGRRPKPTALRELGGNAGHRPINQAEPKVALLRADAPEWLPAEGQAFWMELAPMLTGMRVLTEADRPALVLLCDVYAEWREAREVVRKEGATYEAVTESGFMWRKRPEVSIAADAWRRMRAMLIEFGMTPAARSRITARDDEPGEDDPVDAWLKAR